MTEFHEVEKVVELPLNVIKVAPDRYRRDLGDIASLADSIASVGQMIPIIVDDELNLVAGERRYRAHEHLKRETIRAIIKTRSEINHRILEIVENLERKDFTWQEQILATDDLHKMLHALHGKGWSERKTAKEVGLSVGGVNTDLNLAQAFKADPELFSKCKTKESALKVLQKNKIDEARAELTMRKSRTNYGKKAANHLFLGDCLTLIDQLQDGMINAVISDPFYGLDIQDTKKFSDATDGSIKIYQDNAELYFNTMSSLIKKLDRKMAKDSWILMFCAIQNYNWLLQELEKIDFKGDIVPGIWYRSSNSGQVSQPNFSFGRSYEPFIYAHRGEAVLQKQGQSNVLPYPGVAFVEKAHPVQKPLPLMEELITRLCLPGHIILDPMAGSATTLVACIKCGCIPLGFELDEKFYNNAIVRLAEAFNMKDAGKMELIR